MKQKIMICLFTLGGFCAAAQDSLSRNHFTVGLINGVSINKFSIGQGTRKPANTASILHGVNFQYTRNFTDHYSASAIAGLGFLPFTYRVAPSDSLGGTSPHDYFGRTQYQLFGNLGLQGAYRGRITGKLDYRVYAGLGMRSFGGLQFEIYDMNYLFSGSFTRGAKPYAMIGAGIVTATRNRDEVSLHLSLEQAYRDVYSGTYNLGGGSTGNFANSGSNVNLAIAYTFTGNGRRESVRRLIENDMDKKSARKQYRKEIRYIDPRSTFFSLNAGLGFGINRIQDQGNFFQKGVFGSFVPRATVEKGIAKNYFAEAGFNYFPYWTALKIKGFMTGSMAFDAYQLSLGAGKRIITRNNYNIVNLHAGMTFGATNLRKGHAGSSSNLLYQTDSMQQVQVVFQSVAEHEGKASFVTSAYIGASKDFRLVRNFYLSIGYRFSQGFYAMYVQDMNYTTGNDPEVKHALISINGSSHVFQAGFKLKIDPKLKREGADGM